MRGKLFCTIFTDSRISEDGEANGRTGKTLIVRGLGNMLNTDERATVFVEVNGKDFDPKNKFKFSQCRLDTQLIHINDIFKNYDIDNSFNDITDGINVDKKNDKPFKIFAKMIFSTNKTILINGESSKDRVKVFEFADYYSSKFSPIMEFKQWFFDDWNAMEYARFDRFMIGCVEMYLKHGVIEAGTINLEEKTLVDHTSRDFMNYMKDVFSPGGLTYYDDSDEEHKYPFHIEVSPGREVGKKALYDFYMKLNPDLNWLKQKKFTNWVKMFAKSKHIKIDETRSNGKDYLIFSGYATISDPQENEEKQPF